MSQKRPYVHAPAVLVTGVVRVTGGVRGMVPGWGMGTGWVAGGGNTGTQPAARGGVQNQRSGPRKPLQGAGVGGFCSPGARSCTTPAGPGRCPLGPSLYRTSSSTASWPIRARFSVFLVVYCQNDEVSLKYVEKACLSPYFQNRVQNSPLDFLRFPFSVAFSPKELMGLF